MTTSPRDDTHGSRSDSTDEGHSARRGRGSHSQLSDTSVASSHTEGLQHTVEAPTNEGPLDDTISRLLPPPETLPDGRRLIIVGHLGSKFHNVYQDVQGVFKECYVGIPPTYSELTQTEKDIWVSKFAEKYVWHSRTSAADDVEDHLHQMWAKMYRGRKGKIISDYRRKFPLTAEQPTYDHWRAKRPREIPHSNWEKLIDTLNTEEFKKISERGRHNATTEAAKKPRKKHGSKTKHSVYEEMVVRERRVITIADFRRHWDGAKNSQFEEEYTKLVLEKYPNNDAPPFDQEIFRAVTGGPVKGRWVGAPPQLVNPEQFRPPQPSRRELAVEEARRKAEAECLRLEYELRRIKEDQTEYEVHMNRIVQLERHRAEEYKAHMNRSLQLERRWTEELRRQYDASFSVIWPALLDRGIVQRHQVPHNLVAGGSSSQRQRDHLTPPNFRGATLGSAGVAPAPAQDQSSPNTQNLRD